MQILRENIRADGKRLVSTNMELTESGARGFWPPYHAFQKELHPINDRRIAVIESYAADYKVDPLTGGKAKKLLDEVLAVEKIRMKRAFAPWFQKVLPARKVARYLQIESKIGAIVRYELAAAVPLVQYPPAVLGEMREQSSAAGSADTDFRGLHSGLSSGGASRSTVSLLGE